MPSSTLPREEAQSGIALLDLMLRCGLISSKGEGRRLIQQGGVSVDGEKISDPSFVLSAAALEKGETVIKKGKKVFHKVIVE